MIARVWQGFAVPSNAPKGPGDLQKWLLPSYLSLPGNQGAFLLTRSQLGCAEFLVISLWDPLASLKALTGGKEDEQSILPAESHDDLLNPIPIVKHYEVVSC